MKKPIPFGKYLLLERVNVGGMAEVFKAKAFGVEGFERLVAVKRILPSIAEDQEFITMFIDEAKIAVQLTHANVASIFDLGRVADSYFIAMEFVRGKDLRAIFDRVRKRGETVPVPMACYVIMKVCEGLDYAHNKKDSAGRDLHLVHRDVSPQNILLSYDGEVKLIDFGIAKAASSLPQKSAMPRSFRRSWRKAIRPNGSWRPWQGFLRRASSSTTRPVSSSTRPRIFRSRAGIFISMPICVHRPSFRRRSWLG